MFGLFTPKPIISEASANWIEACFAWSNEHFDGQRFLHNTRLIQPINQDFPGRVDSPTAMAETVLNHVINYSGVNHWPLRLAHLTSDAINQPPLLALNPNSRSGDLTSTQWAPNEILPIYFHPEQCKKPGDLAATFATVLAQHMMMQARQTPPGGLEFFSNAAEVLAVFMGFGVLLANSAYNFRGSCAKCYNPMANRQAELSEAEVVYALALFIHTKNIPLKQASIHLKPHLKSLLKKAHRYIAWQKVSPSTAVTN
ncbi:MAG TPA: hypothetical protein VIZ65_07105 [Cellvibrionaceae bacterium]